MFRDIYRIHLVRGRKSQSKIDMEYIPGPFLQPNPDSLVSHLMAESLYCVSQLLNYRIKFIYAAHPTKAKISFIPWWQPTIMHLNDSMVNLAPNFLVS
jgi:hypothetical protein